MHMDIRILMPICIRILMTMGIIQYFTVQYCTVLYSNSRRLTRDSRITRDSRVSVVSLEIPGSPSSHSRFPESSSHSRFPYSRFFS